MASKPAKNFTWKAGHPLPAIKAHSDRKLEVIERYLEIYFDTVVRDPRMDSLNITLVDGFCGGGMYSGRQGLRYGSPLAILRAVHAASVRLNIDRKKPLAINAVYHFGDSNPDHIDFLRETLRTSEFSSLMGKNIHVHHSTFVDLLPRLLQEIRYRQTQGRSIFVLDQFGYSDVPMATVQQIFKQLPKAEIILTFSIDALLNYLQGERDPPAIVQQFGVTKEFVRMWEGWKQDEVMGRTLAQRTLMTQMHRFSGARFFTPFMMYSATDSREMMVAHLSQSQAARDKMLTVHWETKNTFRHLGKGSLFELGYDDRVETGSLFQFSETDRGNMHEELASELPRRIFDMAGSGPVAYQDFLLNIGNKTAATNADIAGTLRALSDQREIGVISPSGASKRPGTRIQPTDLLQVARQMTFKL